MIRSLRNSRVLLIGDLILDEYSRGSALGLSAETPTIVARHQERTLSHGGAGLLCRNILALGGAVSFLALTGDDEYAGPARKLRHRRLTPLFLDEAGRRTTVKSRFWVNGYKLLQWDRLDNRPPEPATQARIAKLIRERLPGCDKVVVSDYRHGLLTPAFAKDLVAICARAGKPLYVDSQVSQSAANHLWYRGATLFCVNVREAIAADPSFDPQHMRSSMARLRKLLKAATIVVKLGERGCAVLCGRRFWEASPPPVRAVDTTGAGDAFFAVLSAASGEISPAQIDLANTWAALSTTVIGAHPPTLEMLQKKGS